MMDRMREKEPERGESEQSLIRYFNWWDEFVSPLTNRGAKIRGYGPGCYIEIDGERVDIYASPQWRRILSDLAGIDGGPLERL